jgi:hypothetical protein
MALPPSTWTNEIRRSPAPALNRAKISKVRTRYFLSLVVLSITLAASARGTTAFNLESTVLYQPDEPMRARLGSADELAAHIKRLLDVCTAFFVSEKTPERLDIVVGLKPAKKVKVWFVSSRRTSQDKSLIALRKKLEAVPPCAVRGPIAFALRCTIAGGGAAKAEGDIPMPKEWREAATGKNILIPDGIFERIWRN